MTKKKEVEKKVSTSQYTEKVKKERREAIAENKLLVKDLEAKDKEIKAIESHKLLKTNIKLNTPKNNKGSSTAFLVWSDWHIEEIVRSEKTNGLNNFNLKVAFERVSACAYNSAKLVKEMSKSEVIDRVVLFLGGDFFSGAIHEELMENTELRPIDASLKARELLKASIDILLKELKQDIEIICCVGNHSRTTKKIHISNEQENSLEKFMYHFLASDFEKEKRAHFNIAEGYHIYLQVYDYTLRFHHGHAIKYGGGVGGITIPVNKKIQIWNIARPVYLDIFGHFHQFFDGGNFIVNGSLIGYTPYALSIGAKFEVPKQTFFLIKNGYGKTIVAPIFL